MAPGAPEAAGGGFFPEAWAVGRTILEDDLAPTCREGSPQHVRAFAAKPTCWRLGISVGKPNWLRST
eukprot:2324170-Alexandrium_andersonii.AAC.1